MTTTIELASNIDRFLNGAMSEAIFEGQLTIRNYGESDDVLFVGENDAPLAEMLENLAGKTVSIRYWITGEQCSTSEAQEAAVLQVMGLSNFKFDARYSDYTGYLWTDEDLIVGGHDLLKELKSNVGKWLILEATVHE